MQWILRYWCYGVLCVALAGCRGASEQQSGNAVGPIAPDRPDSKPTAPPPLGAPPP